MWLYRCIFILLPYFVNCMKDDVAIQRRSDESEIVFTDVIKNISRVNNVLQELINNYEQLKKMYKSQENSGTEDSDAEIDERFKAKRDEGSETTQRAQLNGDFPATMMFWSDAEENSKSGSGDDKIDKINKKNAHVKDTTEKIEESSFSDPSTAESTDTSTEKEKHHHKTKKTKPALRQNSETLYIDTTKNTAEVKPNTMKSNPIEINKDSDSKTTPVDEKVNNTRSVQKVVYAELFSKNNIWNEILKNKPIQLQRSHVDYGSKLKPGNGTEPLSLLRSVGEAGTDVPDTNNNKNTIEKQQTIEENQQNIQETNKPINEESFDQSEDEVTIKKEQFKTDVLRTAYGDACLNLVVTKCNKACIATGKAVCNKHSCKSNFISKYKSSVRRGCRQEFWGTGSQDSGKGSTKRLYHHRGVTTEAQATEQPEFVDITRAGYVSAACQSLIQDQVEPQNRASLRNETLNGSLNANPDMALNILRDKYEEACKSISAGKCRKACCFAYKTACKDNCNKEKKKYFKQTCRKECQTAYKLRHDDYGSDYSDNESDD